MLALPVVCFSEDTPVEASPSEPTVDEQGALTVFGNLHVEGSHVDFGTTSDGNAALLLSYQENGLTRQVVVYASQSAVEYLWKEGGDDPALAHPKMVLGADNSLTLYDSSGTETIKLSAVSGEISAYGGFRLPDNTLLDGKGALRCTALYSSAGEVVAEVGEDGAITFKNGIVFGGSNTVKLTEYNVAYLQDILSKFGYQENPVEGTAVSLFFGHRDHGALKVAENASGNRIFAGTFSGGTFKFGNTELSGHESLTNHFVAQISASGNLMWSKVWYAGGALVAISTDAVGNVYVAGYFRLSETGQEVNMAGLSVVGTGGYDGYVLMLNASGRGQWVKLISGSSARMPQAVTVDASGNVYICGEYSATAGTSVDLGGVAVTAQGGSDGFVLKLSSAGESLWAKVFGGSSSDRANALIADSVGNVYVGGHVTQTAGRAVNLAGISLNAQGGNDGYVVKLSSTGVTQWAKLLGGAGSDRVAGLVMDSAGSLYVAGSITGVVGASMSLAGQSVTSVGGSDGYLLKLNSAGAAQWATVLGGTSNDAVNHISIDNDDNLYLTGYINGTGSNSVTLAGIPLSPETTGNSFYVLKLNSIGIGQWGSVIPGNLTSVYATQQDTLLICGTGSGNMSTLGGSIVPGGRIPYVAEIPSVSAIVDRSLSANAAFSWGNAVAIGEFAIALGDGSHASGNKSVGLGANANVSGYAASVIGGEGSSATGSYASVVGGMNSHAGAYGAFVGGGESNRTAARNSAVLGGLLNHAYGWSSVIAGGNYHSTRGGLSAIVGGSYSSAEGLSSFIGGGMYNRVTGDSGGVLGGMSNLSSGNYTLSTGMSSTAQAAYSVVIGSKNVVQGNKSAWIATDDLFVVGNGNPEQSVSEHSNAFVVHKNGEMRSGGLIQARDGVRVPPGGDIPMGGFTAGKNPAELNAGLRYEGE